MLEYMVAARGDERSWDSQKNNLIHIIRET
jgi:hypothetical protein